MYLVGCMDGQRPLGLFELNSRTNGGGEMGGEGVCRTQKHPPLLAHSFHLGPSTRTERYSP